MSKKLGILPSFPLQEISLHVARSRSQIFQNNNRTYLYSFLPIRKHKCPTCIQTEGYIVYKFLLTESSNSLSKWFSLEKFCFFLSGFFFHRHSWFTGQQGKGELLSITSTRLIDEILKFDYHCNIVAAKFRSVFSTLSNI